MTPTKKTAVKATATKKRGRPKKKAAVEHKVDLAVKKKIVKHDYLFAVGRRKESIARVRLHTKKEGDIEVNDKKMAVYFPTENLQKIVRMPLELVSLNPGQITIKVSGGGKHGQAESVRLGISRVLEKYNPELRSQLKKAGFLKRDPRVKERKKYGLKKARRAPQWAKR
jgi:small subunit ribosomal protein S9